MIAKLYMEKKIAILVKLSFFYYCFHLFYFTKILLPSYLISFNDKQKLGKGIKRQNSPFLIFKILRNLHSTLIGGNAICLCMRLNS